MTSAPALVLENVCVEMDGIVQLSEISAVAQRGEFLSFLGVPGCGTDCLFEAMAGFQELTSGRIEIAGVDITTGDSRKMEELRQRTVSTIFREDNLLPAMSIRENIILPARLAGVEVTRDDLARVVSDLQISASLDLHAEDASAVDQVRACIARTILSGHEIIVCEDPAHELQSAQSREVLALLRSLARENGLAVVMTTTDAFSAVISDRVILMADGTTRGEIHDPSLQSVFLGLEAVGHQVS